MTLYFPRLTPSSKLDILLVNLENNNKLLDNIFTKTCNNLKNDSFYNNNNKKTHTHEMQMIKNKQLILKSA